MRNVTNGLLNLDKPFWEKSFTLQFSLEEVNQLHSILSSIHSHPDLPNRSELESFIRDATEITKFILDRHKEF